MNKFQTIDNKELANISGGRGIWGKIGVIVWSAADRIYDFGCGVYDGFRGK